MIAICAGELHQCSCLMAELTQENVNNFPTCKKMLPKNMHTKSCLCSDLPAVHFIAKTQLFVVNDRVFPHVFLSRYTIRQCLLQPGVKKNYIDKKEGMTTRQGESKRTKRQCQMKVNQLSGTSALNKRGQCLCCITLWRTRQAGLLIHRDLQYENLSEYFSPVCHHMNSRPLKKSHSKT